MFSFFPRRPKSELPPVADPDGFSPPLRVMAFIATRHGDPDRGPAVRMSSVDAAFRMLQDGELVRIETPRRQEIATLHTDDSLPTGEVVLRDVAGVSPSEIVRVRKIDFDTPQRHGG
jgi:anaerobic selenocysteine-containing dehydrogenase